jgi:hypothetical protein
VSWYLRSTDDHDTHRGTMSRGSVIGVCGIRFAPRTIAFGRKALPGPPPDPQQICERADRIRHHPRATFPFLAVGGEYPVRDVQGDAPDLHT